MSESVCPKCSKPKVQGVHGSITQWMSSCACESVVDPSASQAISVTLCKTCGKRIEVGRSGSFTQWIFRSDKCECEQPVPKETPITAAATGSADNFDPNDDPDEPELQLDAETFPVERYKALREIGHGAAGQVFLCRDRLLGTRVALKRLHHVSSEHLMQFQHEAKATSKLSHPNIVKVLNFGATDGGAPYMVLEFVEGISLEKYLSQHGPLSSQDALSVITQVANALSYSHSKNIFHRDIKSSNIILSDVESGHVSVRIIDFGIAMLTQARQEPTIVQGRTVVGTPAYMPPDQALGQTYDERSEVYSVGCIFFEAFAGEPPFHGETALEVINKHAREAVPRIAEKNPDTDCTPEIEAIIFTCLAKQKEERFQSMAELRDACAAYGKPEVATDDRDFDEEHEKEANLARFERKGLLDGTGMKVAAAMVVIIVFSFIVVVVKQVTTIAPTPKLTKNNLSQNAGGYLEPRSEVKASVVKSLKNGEKVYALSVFWAECGDNDLSIFDHTKVAQDINLSDTNVTDVGLKHFADSPLLTLNLEGTKVRTLKYLPARKTLRNLILNHTSVDDRALANLSEFSALRELRLNGTNVTINGIKPLKHMMLEVLELKGCPNISNADLEKLRDELPMWGVNRSPKINEIHAQINRLIYSNQHQKALEEWKKWYQYSKTHSDPTRRLAITSLGGMSAAADRMKNFPLAQKYLTQATEIATATGEEINLLIINDHWSSHYTATGNRDAAIESGLKAIEYNEKIYHDTPTRLKKTVGLALAAKGEYEHALQLLQPASVGGEKYLADVMKTPAESRSADPKTIRLDIATVYVSIAECLSNLNRFDEVQQKLIEAESHLSELPDDLRKPMLARYYLIKAKNEYQTKNYAQSLRSNDELMRLCRDKAARSEYMLPRARLQYIETLEALGRHGDAEKFKARN